MSRTKNMLAIVAVLVTVSPQALTAAEPAQPQLRNFGIETIDIELAVASPSAPTPTLAER